MSEDTFIKNLEEKYGKTIAEWTELIRKQGLTKHGQIVKWLKSEHGMTHGYANTVSLQARDAMSGAPTTDADIVAAQYEKKQDLKPIYDAIIEAVEGFGEDIELAPKKKYVSLRRSKQFGIVQPSTKTRVDVGINLSDTEPGDRLEASGSFNSMVSHRVRISSLSDVDDELIGWLKDAYEQA